MPNSEPESTAPIRPGLTPIAAAMRSVAAWVVPGAGHWLRGHRKRALFYLVVVAVTLACGVYLDGRISANSPGQPLAGLATIGSMGAGLAYVTLRLLGYQGDLLSQSYEYGTAFLITAGVMNWLLVLDTWDIATGRKEQGGV